MPRENIRQAVDTATEDYWEQYFGAYGKQWVRKIPRRVASALIQRTAGRVSVEEAAAANRSASVRPLHAPPIITDESVRVEGLLQYKRGNHQVTRLFCATFDHDGRLRELDSLPASVA